ncbi:hypothetical protein V8E53_004236 [Lactarius tabidus]
MTYDPTPLLSSNLLLSSSPSSPCLFSTSTIYAPPPCRQSLPPIGIFTIAPLRVLYLCVFSVTYLGSAAPQLSCFLVWCQCQVSTSFLFLLQHSRPPTFFLACYMPGCSLGHLPNHGMSISCLRLGTSPGEHSPSPTFRERQRASRGQSTSPFQGSCDGQPSRTASTIRGIPLCLMRKPPLLGSAVKPPYHGISREGGPESPKLRPIPRISSVFSTKCLCSRPFRPART